MPVPVWFAEARSRNPASNGVAKLGRLLEAAGLPAIVRPGDLSAIKVHFGELGNEAFCSPVLARAIADAVRAAGGKPFFADTNTLYTGSRSNAVDHLETAILHGYDRAVAGAPILIADGFRGGDWREVGIPGKWLKKAKIASAFLDADSMIVLSHFKGHEMAGFGGAIKNLAMGCAPAAGKREQHSCRFFVKPKKCVDCGTCIEVCPAKAIRRVENTEAPRGQAALVDRAACIGCGECATRCATKAIGMDWKVELPEFTEKMVEYALAAQTGKKDRLLHILLVKDVVPDCDCASWSDLPVVTDQGMLASTDPVAIDQAAWDLVRAAPAAPGSALEGKAGPGDCKFTALHPETRCLVQLEHGERIGLGTRDYELRRV